MTKTKIQKICACLWHNKIIRYVFWGGCTTLVNFLTYYLLKNVLNLSVNNSNFVSVITAIVFAYFVNAKFVFDSTARTLLQVTYEFGKFVSVRLLSMLIEIFGVLFLVDFLFVDDLCAKFATQIIVLIVNYVVSKFVVFCRNKKGVV